MRNISQESGESSLRVGQIRLFFKFTDPNTKGIREFVFFVQ